MPKRSIGLSPRLGAMMLLASAPGCCWHAVKPLPSGVAYRSALLPVADIRFLCDQTSLDAAGARQSDQQIFDAIFTMIARAERLIVADMFLFNEFLGAAPAPHRPLCEELTAALIARVRAAPGLRIVLITDPVNTVYGGLAPVHLKRLEEAGIEVVVTRLDRLRDSNVTWSSIWRLLVKPWGNNTKGGWVTSPFGAGEVTLRSWLALLNFKANHRKVVVADDGDAWSALVTSANPHDGSSAHSNVAVAFSGSAACELLKTEQAVMAFSAKNAPPFFDEASASNTLHAGRSDTCPLRIQVVTEEAIAEAAAAMLNTACEGDAVDLVMFYLSDRAIIRALKAAAGRRAHMRVVLDPNKDAFGREKNGMPNRQVARELTLADVPVRWAATHGEQMHSKLLLLRRTDGSADLLLGSANFTRRNLRNYNLETDVRVTGPSGAAVFADATAYVDRLWTNAGGHLFTTDYRSFRDDSSWRTFLYRIQEATGLCTW